MGTSPGLFLRSVLRPLMRWRSQWLVLLALLATLAGPFLLKPDQSVTAQDYDRRLVILSPHNERVRQEIGHAFATDWKTRTGERVYVDWRIPGGASEVALFLKSEFAGAFEYDWKTLRHRPWNHEVSTAFSDSHVRLDASGDHVSPGLAARRAFLESSIGIEVDLLFGGGSYDFQQQAEAGYLVAGSAEAGTGLNAISARHPDWFTPEAIPQAVSGEPFRDPQNRWAGAILATFGIIYNRDVLHRLHLPDELSEWADLADPRLIGQVALSDPTKSGSVAKAFELIIQQQMTMANQRLAATRNPHSETDGVDQGWLDGLRLIQQMSANARYFTDSASKISLEVSGGDAAAGMAIDSYGRSTQEYVRQADGYSRVGFVAPMGGTSVSVDPIAMLRGASEPELATAFMEFVLSSRGQKLWAFRPGTDGGPVQSALRRLPVRRDFYTEENRHNMTDPKEQPYLQAESFTYHPEWTAPLFGAIRFLIRVMCVDTHDEQRRAWRALVQAGLPTQGLAAFHDLEGLSRAEVIRRIVPVLQAKDKVAEVRLSRELGMVFRERYQRAFDLARTHGAKP